MSTTTANVDNVVRPLRPSDLDRVIAIDSGHVGRPRRRFFEKRLAHAKQHPEDFVQVGVTRNETLVGFAFVRIQRGEFGRDQAVATLDAVGVEQDIRERGAGHALMDSLVKVMRAKKVQSLQSQADWTNHALLRFFDGSGFWLAPRMVLERSGLSPLTEPVEEE